MGNKSVGKSASQAGEPVLKNCAEKPSGQEKANPDGWLPGPPRYKLHDLIDIPQFQALQDRLNEIYSFPSAIIDNDGNILTATAWQDICTKFHRTNKECEQECVKSDQYILAHLAEANPAVSYRCPHGLIDNATPILIEDVHYGNFFTGQFFLEEPDLEFYRKMAQRYGFDENAYLEAVKNVPIWTQKQLESYLFFIKGLIEVISSSGMKKLKEIEARKRIEADEERAGAILSQMMDGFWITIGSAGKIVDVNHAMCRMVGYTRDELLDMSIADVEAIDAQTDIERRILEVARDGSAHYESRFRRKDGSLIDVEVSVSYLQSMDMFFGFHRDITKRKQAEMETTLRLSFETLLANIQAKFLNPEHNDWDSAIVDVQRQICSYLDADRSSLWQGTAQAPQTLRLTHLCTLDEILPVAKDLMLDESCPWFTKQLLSEQTVAVNNIYTLPPEASVDQRTLLRWGDRSVLTFPVIVGNPPIYAAFGFGTTKKAVVWSESKVAQCRILAQTLAGALARKQAEVQIRKTLAEKETLLRELYHRTKNNMQVIRSMLVLQSMNSDSSEVQKLVQETDSKIMAMATVHQMLYQSQNLSSINLETYIRELVDLASASYQTLATQVNFELDLEPVSVTIDVATPVGLIFDELLSNAFKHAFPAGYQGTIQIQLRRREPGMILIKFADNGVGVPEGFDLRQQTTYGLVSIFSLVESQLNSHMTVDTRQGVRYNFEFSDALYRTRL